MALVQNFPFFSIILAMFAGIISSILSGRKAKWVNLAVISIVTVMSGMVLAFLWQSGESYTYMMGHFPAPWGNEIRAGVLEALTAFLFCIVMLLSIIGGMDHIFVDVESTKINLFFVLVDLILSSLLALIYTNDLFTAYVFIEINTIAGCGLIMMRQKGKAFTAAIRYMVMSQLGSGLFLIGLSLLYDVTGHLLMSNAKEAITLIMANGSYTVPMLVIISVISVGLAIKSGLYPFHSWIPDAYSSATPAASAILSGLVSKGYIFLLIKLFYRVLGEQHIIASHIVNVLFVFGLCGMIMGSVHAISETDTRRMIAYSSVAQIGYIYLGIGLGTQAGMTAALFHLFGHAATKALLFVSSVGLYEVSGNKKDYLSLRGAGYRNRLAGIGFAIGALSMVGLPMLSGFISKLLFASAATLSPGKMIPTILGLGISTLLNAVYFLRLVITLYSPAEKMPDGSAFAAKPGASSWNFRIAVISFIILNIVLGVCSQPIVRAIEVGLQMFD